MLALLMERDGRLAAAAAQLDTLLAQRPGDTGARALRERVRAERAGAGR